MHFEEHRSTDANPWRALLGLIAAITVWRLGAAWLLPVTQDEAYYFDWSRTLAWGYFDHPPGVALLGLGTLLAPGSALMARLGTVAASTATLLFLAALYRRCGMRESRDLLLATIISFATLPGLAGGLITTPDSALALCWAAALHEGVAALTGDRRRWLSAGLATGIGLLCKYTMVLIGPVFLWALLRADPRALRTPWPYLGALLALLAFSPNILWNAHNDWVTMRFQFGHGFSTETGQLLDNSLPPPIGTGTRVAQAEEPFTTSERIEGVLGYLGTQAGLWGMLLIPLAAPATWRRRDPSLRTEIAGTLDPKARTLLGTAALFPLLFFGLVASFSEVEPNWPGVYLMAAAPFAAVVLRPVVKWALAAAAANVLVATLYVLHGATSALPLPDSQQRILRETHGYRELAQRVAELQGPIFADRYQTAAMVNFYQPHLRATQWPGLTRPSEYLRGSIAPSVSLDEIRRSGGFHLISRSPSAPNLPGVREMSRTELHDCAGKGLVEVTRDTPARPCRKPLHIWSIYSYTPIRDAADGK